MTLLKKAVIPRFLAL